MSFTFVKYKTCRSWEHFFLVWLWRCMSVADCEYGAPSCPTCTGRMSEEDVMSNCPKRQCDSTLVCRLTQNSFICSMSLCWDWRICYDSSSNSKYYYCCCCSYCYVLPVCCYPPRFYHAFASVCVLTTSRKNYWPEIHDNFPRYVSVDKEECVNHPHLDKDPEMFGNIPQHCEKKYFPNLAQVSGKTDRMFMKSLSQLCVWTSKSPLNFGIHPDSLRVQIRTLDKYSRSEPDSRWWRSVLSDCVCYMRCLWLQATCLIKFSIDMRGTVIQDAWEARCREPGDPCPTECVMTNALMQETCYKCNIPATCEGWFSLHAVWYQSTSVCR